MTAAYGDVPLLDPETGRFPDSFAPPSVAAAVTDAQTARTGAETAHGLAEDARDAAQTARTGAETAQGLAEDARDAAQAASAVTVASGAVVGDDLILTRTDTTTVNAGNVRGRDGTEGPMGPAGPSGPGVTPTSVYPLAVAAYDRKPSVGHPSVIHIPGGWNGYAYWMAVTPFPTSVRENPSIYASADGVNWVVPNGLTNPVHPLATAVAMGYDYWADTEITLTPDNSTLIMIFKGTKTGQLNQYVRSTSTDGVTWTAPSVVVSTTAAVSPSLVWETDGSLTMFEGADPIYKRTSADHGLTWTARTGAAQPNLPAPYTPWHIDVTRVGSVYHALISASVPTGTGPYRLFHWTSIDGGATWGGAGATATAVPLSGSRFDTRGHYRSAILPAVSGAAGRFDLWLTMMDESLNNHDSAAWRLGVIRDWDFASPASWPPSSELARHTADADEVWVMAGEMTATVGAPLSGLVTGWPGKGLRDGFVDGLGIAFPPLPTSWHHYTVELLVVHNSAVGGGFVLPTRSEAAGAGDTITTGGFKQIVKTAGAQNVLQWVDLLNFPAVDPIACTSGQLFKVTVERSTGNASDTLPATLWVIAARARRVRNA